MAEVWRALRARAEQLRQRLRDEAGLDTAPEEGSDAALLLDALFGAPPEAYLPGFEASARRLAEQGGHLEARMAGIQRWQAALARAIESIFADDPLTMAQAQETLGTLYAQIVVVITRAYQSVQTRQTAQEREFARRGLTRLQALQRINAAANSTLDLDQTLSTTAHTVAQEMNADICVIFLFDDITRELQLRATSGPYPRTSRHLTANLGQGYTGWVAEHGRPLIVADALADPRFADEAGAYGEGYHGLLSVPIIFFTVEKLEGVLTVQMREPHTFSEEDTSFLEIVAGQLAMSIENGRLYEQTDEELRRKVHELNTLHRVSALVSSTLVLDNVLQMIVAQAVQLSGADRSVLFELDPATQQLTAVASHGFEDSEVTAQSVRVGQCCAGRVVQTGEPRMQIDCMQSDESCFLHHRPDATGDQHSVLCVPLIARHGPLGALCVFSSQRHLLNNHQLQLVMTFANVAAIAMENARLFEQTREGLRTKEALLREMHHRVKNNLQQVASILNMQRRRAKNPEVEQILVESVDRIQGIAATHDLLSNAQFGLARIDEIARKIAGIVQSNLVPPRLHIRFSIGAAPFHLPSEQATTLAIVLNELIANAIEHGFEGREQGEIRIGGVQDGDHVVVRVADDGAGLPEHFSIQTSEGLGLQLVRGLVQTDLHGAVTMFSAAGDPDLGEHVERLTDPQMAAVLAATAGTVEGVAPAPERIWTIAQLSFPLTLTREAQRTEPAEETA